MKSKKIFNSLCLAVTLSLSISLFPIKLHAESIVQEEIVSEESGFDENAHGEVKEEGLCGLLNPYRASYKIYEDGTLYVNGYGAIGEIESNATFLYIENGITEIGEYAFASSKIESIRFPSTLENIGESAFNFCKIKELNIPYGIKNIGESAFSVCNALERISISSSVEMIKSSSFSGCGNLKSIEVSNENEVYDSRGNCNAIIETKNNRLVRGCTNTNIPSGITVIGENAFSNCSGLTSVFLPDGIKEISDRAFIGCENLTNIELPYSIEEIGFAAFSSCSSLKEILLPNNIKYIADYLFNDCSNLENIQLPNGVEILGENSFRNCSNLTTLKMPDSLSEIGRFAFEECVKLSSLEISKNVKKIESNAFKDCENLIIHCNSGSVAEQYAKDNNIKFELLDNEEEKKPEETPETPENKPSEGNGEKEEIPDISETPELPISSTFNGCKESPVKLSIKCKESDEFTFECLDDCGMQSKYAGYSSIISPLGSSYKKNYELIFTESGEHIISIYKNGNLLEHDKIIVAENHTWDSGNVDKKATCTQNGKIKYTCTNCENTKIESIPATGHNYSKTVTRNATCTENGMERYTCLKCRDSYTEMMPKTEHKYGEWKISKKPTIFKSGTEKISCTICGRTLQTREIKKLKSSVKISKTKLNLKVGKTYKFKIKKQSKGDKVTKWTTSNKNIVSVNKKTGTAKALKKGKAKITITMKSGCTATCTVMVK